MQKRKTLVLLTDYVPSHLKHPQQLKLNSTIIDNKKEISADDMWPIAVLSVVMQNPNAYCSSLGRRLLAEKII
jgi:hypothetical protein